MQNAYTFHTCFPLHRVYNAARLWLACAPKLILALA